MFVVCLWPSRGLDCNSVWWYSWTVFTVISMVSRMSEWYLHDRTKLKAYFMCKKCYPGSLLLHHRVPRHKAFRSRDYILLPMEVSIEETHIFHLWIWTLKKLIWNWERMKLKYRAVPCEFLSVFLRFNPSSNSHIPPLSSLPLFYCIFIILHWRKNWHRERGRRDLFKRCIHFSESRARSIQLWCLNRPSQIRRSAVGTSIFISYTVSVCTELAPLKNEVKDTLTVFGIWYHYTYFAI